MTNSFFFWYQVIRDNLDGLMDVTVFDAHVQPTSANQVGFNPCHEDNGRCQQFCFAMPGQEKPKCGCAHGSLLSNGVTCGYGLDEFLVFTTDYTLNSLRLDPADHSTPYPTVNLGYNLMALDYDFKEKRIFFTQYLGIGRSRIGYITTSSPTSPPVNIATSEFNIYCYCVCPFVGLLLLIYISFCYVLTLSHLVSVSHFLHDLIAVFVSLYSTTSPLCYIAQIWMTQRDWHMTGSTSVSTSLTTINAMSSLLG